MQHNLVKKIEAISWGGQDKEPLVHWRAGFELKVMFINRCDALRIQFSKDEYKSSHVGRNSQGHNV